MKKALIVALAIGLTAASARADILAQYTFTGSARTSSDADPLSVASTFDDGTGFTSSFDLTRGNSAPSLAVVSTVIDGSTQAAAVTAGDYFTFTITPTTGTTLNLSSLTFDYANYTNDGTFPTETFFARSNQDSFAANLASAVTATTGSAGVFATATITLGAAFQNLTTPVEFRIYLSDGTNDADRGALIDNVVLNGTAIPEPSTWAMLGVGSILLLAGQKLRRRRA